MPKLFYQQSSPDTCVVKDKWDAHSSTKQKYKIRKIVKYKNLMSLSWLSKRNTWGLRDSNYITSLPCSTSDKIYCFWQDHRSLQW